MNVFQAEKQQGNNTVVGWGRGWSGASCAGKTASRPELEAAGKAERKGAR